MKRLQAYKFKIEPNGEQIRNSKLIMPQVKNSPMLLE